MKTSVISPNPTRWAWRARPWCGSGRFRISWRKEAMQALVISTSTPVAYAPPCAETSARKAIVTTRLMMVKAMTSGR